MNTKEILLRNGAHPDFLSRESIGNFEFFCRNASHTAGFIHFVDEFESFLSKSIDTLVDLKIRGADLTEQANKATDKLSVSAESTILSAFNNSYSITKEDFFIAVTALEEIKSHIKSLLSHCYSDETLKEKQSELFLRYVALKEFSSDKQLIERFAAIIKKGELFQDKLAEFQNRTAVLFENAICAISKFEAEGEKILSDKSRNQSAFYSLLYNHQTLLHQITQNLKSREN